MSTETRPHRFKDKHLARVDAWTGGCLYCGDPDVYPHLPGSERALTMPLCQRHIRWAMVSRREKIGKQARNLKLLLFAWCRLHGDDREVAKAWLGY
jgi:hypothetical protein